MPTLIIWWDYLPHDIDPCVPHEKNLAAALLEIDVEGNFQVDPNVNSIAEPALSAVENAAVMVAATIAARLGSRIS
jgi:hypothetical protein